MSNPIALMLSRRNSLLQNTSLDDIGRWEGRSLRDARERFILSRRGENRCGPTLLPFTLPLMSSPSPSSAADDLLLIPLMMGPSARDCSASSSESISYEDVSSGTVANCLDDWWLENDREESDDDNDSVLFVFPVLVDKNAVLVEEEVVIGMLKLRRWVMGVVKEDDVVARSATVSDEYRAGGTRVRVMMEILLQ